MVADDDDDEEQGRGTPVGGRADEVAMVDLALNLGSERVAGLVDERARGDEGVERGVGKVFERGMRTGTEGTLVGDDDEEGGDGGKGVED